MWSKVFLLVLDDRGAALRDSVKSYRKRYNIDSNREVNIREVIDNGGCTGKNVFQMSLLMIN